MNEDTSVVKTKTASVEQPKTDQRQPVHQATVTPAVDILETETGISIVADMPGVSKDRLIVKVDGDHLVIEGAASVTTPQNIELLYAEIRNPHFRRSFTLSRELDPSKIEASLKDGVLRLHIPKSEEARPRRIEISVA